jgi:hypothetical protein
MHSLVIAYYLVLWPYSNMMTETRRYDLQNIIVIAVKMRGIWLLSVQSHLTNQMGRLAKVSLLSRIPHAVPQYNYIEYDR